MELKVWVEGIQRIVCGVTEKTTCQDVVYALAHATGRTGRFTLIERWRNNERLLAPQEHPLKVLTKWGEYSPDVQFILQRSPLDAGKGSDASRRSVPPPLAPAPLPGGAIWKTPPGAGKPLIPSKTDAARLSPDSGQGSDPTGSDTSTWSDQERARHGYHQPPSSSSQLPPTVNSNPSSSHPSGLPPSGYQPPGWGGATQRFTSPSPDRGGGGGPLEHQYQYGYGAAAVRRSATHLPPYRHPPQPHQRHPSPSGGGDIPPPYREPPPPPGSRSTSGLLPTSPTQGRHMMSPVAGGGGGAGRPPSHHPPHPYLPPPHSPTPPRSYPPPSSSLRQPHYSPPPHHRELPGGRGHHSGRGPSPGRGHAGTATMSSRAHGSPARGHSSSVPPSSAMAASSGGPWRGSSQQPPDVYNRGGPLAQEPNYRDLLSLVSAQQTRLQSQHAEIKHCDNELKHWSYQSTGVDYLPSQLEAVLQEVRRLEEAANKNEEELLNLSGSSCPENRGIRSELDHLKHRLEMTDLELQKTNATLRRLGDEMRSYSQEKTKQREEELKLEMERIQQEIRVLQRSSEDSANVSDKLNKEVQEVEVEIQARKGEVERLIQDMKSANLESLTISPPEETRAFLDGPLKQGSTRKMLGSPRQLENAVPTSKNPHGVWV